MTAESGGHGRICVATPNPDGDAAPGDAGGDARVPDAQGADGAPPACATDAECVALGGWAPVCRADGTCVPEAEAIFVDRSRPCNDAGAGTADAPLCEITAGLGLVGPGRAAIVVGPGTYGRFMVDALETVTIVGRAQTTVVIPSL